MTPARLRGIWLAALSGVMAVVVTASTGCSRAPRSAVGWAAEVAATHRTADRRLDEGDVAGARSVLTSLLVAKDRPAAAPSPTERLGLQDTYFRLARLALGEHDARQALAYAEAGLALGTTPHLFVANLYIARGAAHEALNDNRTAADDYHQALAMNEALLREALPREGAAP